jgi:RimJ/RimL family protein N-acetyltransferase
MLVLRAVRLRREQAAVYRAESLRPADMTGLAVEVLGPGDRMQPDQREFLGRHSSTLALWYLLRWRRRGCGWVLFGRIERRLCHYTFVTPARRYRRMIPLLKEPRALLIGPCLTEEEFRGRAIYPRVLGAAVGMLRERGWGPFYIHTNPLNAASVRGIEKAGFTRCGVWDIRRVFFNLWVSSRRIGD